MNTYQTIMECNKKITCIQDLINIDQLEQKLSEIDHLANNQSLWNNPKAATKLMKERQKLSYLINKYKSYKERIDFFNELLSLMPNEIETCNNDVNALLSELNDFETHLLFKDELDDSPAILSINAGAGGLEAANFVTMILRMYVRYANNNNFNIEILDTKPSEEHSSICTDSVSIRIEGQYAYGFFKSESGVHRLIRNSPFNSGNARHTSFAAVSVLPDIEDTIDIIINDKDLEITAMRASGSGGQAVNKVNSAVRIKHLPTGINIAVRTERDFHQNKRTALKMLKSKLYDMEMKKKQDEKDQYFDSMSDAAFGHQIRSYILSPTQIVKDHRTNCESNSTLDVLDGNINDFIIAFLRKLYE